MNKMKVFIYIVIIIVAGSIVAGFFIVDSPAETRLRRFDEQRVSDLSVFQSEILNFWMAKRKLPENLDALQDSLRGFMVPKDPETNTPYIYEIVDEKKLKFALCANFATNNSQDWWGHSSGEVCFDRTIDPELYPPAKK